MRNIKNIVVHCSATPPSMDIGADEIRKWHTEERGWTDIGYHVVIRRDGTVEQGRPLDIAGAHVAGHNATSIGICYVGGVSESGQAEDNRTADQSRVLFETISSFKEQFPQAEVLGHRDFKRVKKSCPSFDVKQWYNEACNTRKEEPQPEKAPEKETVPQSTTYKSWLSIISTLLMKSLFFLRQ